MARPRSDIRERVLEAARSRFLRHGVDGASLRNIAKDAGTNVGMLYYYFPTKDDLFFEIVEEVYAELVKDLGTALEGDAEFVERVRRLYIRIGKMSETELEVARLMAREAMVSGERMRRFAERARSGHLALILKLVQDGVAGGALKSEVHPVALMMAVMSLGVVPQLMRNFAAKYLPFADVPEGEALSSLLAELLFTGVGSAPPQAELNPTARNAG